MPLISDGEYKYEYNDFLKSVGALDTSKNSGYYFDNDPAPLDQSPIKQSPSSLNQDQSDTASYSAYLKATPPTPEIQLIASVKKPVKIATPQYVNFQNDINAEDADFLKMLYFEQINGTMLLSLTNNANLNTDSVNYQPIINMAEIQKALDPKGILALQNTSDKYFLNFPIKLETKIPNSGNGPAGTNVYINFSTGNLVIESINLNPGEKIEIETLQNGTIYETDLGVDELW